MACAVGQRVIDIIRREGLDMNARHVGNQLKDGLSALSDRYFSVMDKPRGLGLMVGVALKSKEDAPAFTKSDKPPSAQLVDMLHAAGMLTVGSGEQIVRPRLTYTTGKQARGV